MKSKIWGALLMLCLNTWALYPQAGYLAGTGQECIEPDESLISLHLAGYGAPRDGRFTLQWKNIGKVPEPTAFAGSGTNLFIVSGGELFAGTSADHDPVWKLAGMADNIKSLAASDGRLFGINGSGEVLARAATGKSKWKKSGLAFRDAILLAATGGRLYATDGKGTLWTSPLSAGRTAMEKSDMPDNIAALAGNDGKLYALAADGVIYRRNISGSDRRWLMMAYKNNSTIREDIRQIAFLNNRIYGITAGNILCLGEHRSEGNLTARALAIRKGGQTVVLVNVDLCGLTADFTGLVKKELRDKYQLPPAAIFINLSHTHFAPVSQNWLTWQEANQRPDSTYLYTTVRNGITGAVSKALAALAPADLWFGRGSADIGYNRSLKDHPELYDSDVDVLKVDYSDGRPGNYLFIAACHPVFSTSGTLNYTISANYPGVARKLVEERTGTSNSLFLQGTAGDINPRDNGEYITGEKLSNSVIDVLSMPMKKLDGPITFFLDTIAVPVTPWSRDEISAFRAENAEKPGDVYAEKNVKWCDLMTDYYSKGRMPDALPVYISTINIGNWKLVGFSRETTTGYGLGVKKLWPGKLVSVTGYTNDVSSYLPTHMHLEAKTYEGLDSFFWYGQANVFPMNVDETILDRIRSLAH